MADVHDIKTRSRNMAAIKGRNSKPEMLIRRGLHALGHRFRLHDGSLPGRPDVVLPKHRAVIFVHGCFWHGHECHLFKWPTSREEFWRQKIATNKRRDRAAINDLGEAGWRVAEVWECAIKGKYRKDPDAVIKELAHWVRSDAARLELKGGF